MSFVSSLMRKTSLEAYGDIAQTPKHLGMLMLAALGIGGAIGAGIFAMPGIIALKAGAGGVLSFTISGVVILLVAICYERFSMIIPHGSSAYSYVYHSIGELVAWIVAFGLFLEYSFGASAVAIGWAAYLKRALSLDIPSFWCGPTTVDGHFVFGINAIAVAVILAVNTILILGGVKKSARLNFALVCLKLVLLTTFLVVGIGHVDPVNWSPFMPRGFDGVLQGAAIALFPYIGFDALFTFSRESKSPKDTRLATYSCVGIVAFLYITVMAVATGLAPSYISDGANTSTYHPNTMFAGSEAAAPLAVLLAHVGEGWTSKFIAFGAVLGIFNVLLVLCMGGPRIFRNMAEDGLLPHIFAQSHNGNPVFGICLNTIMVALTAGLVPFGQITDMMVLGTLVAFIFVCIGAVKLKLVNLPLGAVAAICCLILAFKLDPLVLKVYSISCPVGLLIYFFYGRSHSKLALLQNGQGQEQITAAVQDA
jgi:basic amino acid/polyamine antiporter, APA family